MNVNRAKWALLFTWEAAVLFRLESRGVLSIGNVIWRDPVAAVKELVQRRQSTGRSTSRVTQASTEKEIFEAACAELGVSGELAPSPPWYDGQTALSAKNASLTRPLSLMLSVFVALLLINDAGEEDLWHTRAVQLALRRKK